MAKCNQLTSLPIKGLIYIGVFVTVLLPLIITVLLMQGVLNEAFDKDSSTDDEMFADEIEVDRSYIQRLEVRTLLFFFHCS